MEEYEIRYCKLEEVDLLQSFLDQHWKKGHILSQSKELLDYQHKNLQANQYNFVVAYHKTRKEFDVILGFIPFNHYDTAWNDRRIWLAIWKKNDQEHPRGLGTSVLNFLEADYQPHSIFSIGINDTIEQLYLKRGWRSGIFNHWYFLRAGQLISFKPSGKAESDYFENPFHKSDNYYLNRFDQHPFYI